MRKKYEVFLPAHFARKWQFTTWLIEYDHGQQRLSRLIPSSHENGTDAGESIPELVMLTQQALLAYLQKDWQKITAFLPRLQLELIGTQFQVAVWQAIGRITVGQTVTYQDLATEIGRPRAVRAVGSACAANPFPFLIPCHRVVGSSGFGGYQYGLDLKRNLLDHEKIMDENAT